MVNGMSLAPTLRNDSIGQRGGRYMSIIGWILFGLVVGIVGKLLMPGRDPGGFILTILLGVAGALLGGFVGQSLGFYQEGEPAGFLMAVVGSIVLLLLYRLFVGRRDRI
jgi:uncharacterized membrane protein YeaQ/YmgE (transglycosylase-associated protein family)